MGRLCLMCPQPLAVCRCFTFVRGSTPGRGTRFSFYEILCPVNIPFHSGSGDQRRNLLSPRFPVHVDKTTHLERFFFKSHRSVALYGLCPLPSGYIFSFPSPAAERGASEGTSLAPSPPLSDTAKFKYVFFPLTSIVLMPQLVRWPG